MNTLQRAKKQREEVGVELYGYQQNLAKLQMSLEAAHDKYQQLSTARQQVTVAGLEDALLIDTCLITSATAEGLLKQTFKHGLHDESGP